jgi:hypothetical protein
MKHAVLATLLAPATLLLASPPVAAHEQVAVHDHKCDVESDWAISMHRRAFVFTKEGQVPAEVGLGGGRMFIDAREQKLSAADHARLARLENEMHAFVPQLREVATEAVDIAFTALTEVARGLASDPKASVADLETARKRIRAEMEAKPLTALDGDAIGKVIGSIMVDYVPQIIGGAVSGALSAAFGGEQKAKEFEKKMEAMERELDQKVEQRAKKLEPLAEAMCKRLQEMDRIDDELDFRLPDGKRLELLRVGPREKN